MVDLVFFRVTDSFIWYCLSFNILGCFVRLFMMTYICYRKYMVMRKNASYLNKKKKKNWLKTSVWAIFDWTDTNDIYDFRRLVDKFKYFAFITYTLSSYQYKKELTTFVYHLIAIWVYVFGYVILWQWTYQNDVTLQICVVFVFTKVIIV